MLSAKEYEDNAINSVIQRISASDSNDITVLCKAAEGDQGWQTGSCSVSLFIFIFFSFLKMAVAQLCWKRCSSVGRAPHL